MSAYSMPVRCQIERISILLNIHTKKCTFSDQNPCGNHGICQEIQKNVLHYATCNCFKGNIISTYLYVPLQAIISFC